MQMSQGQGSPHFAGLRESRCSTFPSLSQERRPCSSSGGVGDRTLSLDPHVAEGEDWGPQEIGEARGLNATKSLRLIVHLGKMGMASGPGGVNRRTGIRHIELCGAGWCVILMPSPCSCLQCPSSWWPHPEHRLMLHHTYRPSSKRAHTLYTRYEAKTGRGE